METIVWDSSNQIVDKNFNYMIKNYYSNFDFKYKWNNNVIITDYLKRLFINSFIEDESIRNDLPVLIHNFEDFFAVSINEKIFTKENIYSVFEKIKKSIKVVGYTKSDILLSESNNDKILINKDLRVYLRVEKESSLSPIEMRKVYLFREIIDKILNFGDKEFINIYKETIEKVIEEKGNSVDLNLDKDIIDDGFLMIKELLSQSLAEHLAYISVDKERPKFRVVFENDFPVASNLDSRCLYEKPVINLGKTLAGVFNKSDNNTLLNMAKLALSVSLPEALVSQYKEGNAQKYFDLFIILQNFGALRRGNDKTSSIFKVDYENVYATITKITERNLGNNLLNISKIKPLNLKEYLNV